MIPLFLFWNVKVYYKNIYNILLTVVIMTLDSAVETGYEFSYEGVESRSPRYDSIDCDLDEVHEGSPPCGVFDVIKTVYQGLRIIFGRQPVGI